MKAAVRTTKNTDFEKSNQLSDNSQKLILNQKNDILVRCSIDRNTTPWMSTTSLHDRAVKLSKAEVHVYSDSVLCPAKIHQHPHSMEAWNQNIEWFMVSLENGFYWRRTTRVRVDRFPRAHNTAVASWDPKDDDREQDPTWTVQRSNHLHVDVQRHLLETISWEVKAYAQKCPQSRWSIGHSSNREPKKNGTERTLAGQGLWDRSAGMMMLHIREREHPVFRATNALDRGSLKSKRGREFKIHYNGDLTTAELLFRLIISVNQFSVCGAISNRCEDLAQPDLRSFVFQYGEICGEYEWRVGVSNITQRRVNLHGSTFDQCPRTKRLVAKP